MFQERQLSVDPEVGVLETIIQALLCERKCHPWIPNQRLYSSAEHHDGKCNLAVSCRDDSVTSK